MNLHIFGPQVIVAANTFCAESTSKIAKDTFELFTEMWRYLINDVIQADLHQKLGIIQSPLDDQ